MESKNIVSDKQESTRFGWRFNDVPALVPIKKRRIQIFEVSRSPSPPPKQPSPVLENSPPSKYVLDSPSSKIRVDILPSSTKSTLDSIDTNLSPTSHCSKLVCLSPSVASSKDTSIQSLRSTPLTSEEDSNQNYLSLEESQKTILHSLESETQLQSILSPDTISPGKWPFPEGELLIGSSPKPQFPSIKNSKEISLSLEGSPKPLLCEKNSERKVESTHLLTSEVSFPDGEVLTASSPKPQSLSTKLSSPNVLSSGIEVFSKPAIPFSKTVSSTTVQQSLLYLAIHPEINDEPPTNIEKGKLYCLENSFVPADENRCDDISQEVEDGELVISRETNMEDLEVIDELPEVTSQGSKTDISRMKPNFKGLHDDRSCWDLNREMDSWDKITNSAKEKSSADISSIQKDNLDGYPGKIASVDTEPKLNDNNCVKDGLRGLVEITTILVNNNEHGIAECTGVDANNGLLGDDIAGSITLKEVHHEAFCEPEIDSPPKSNDFQVENHEKHTWRRHGGLSRTRDGSTNELPEVLEAEEQMDYSGGSESESDVDDKNEIEFDNRELIQDDRYQETGSLVSRGSKTISDSSQGERKQDENLELQKSCTTGRIRSTGWDQLPIGFDNAEEALKAARETLIARRGRGGRTSTSRPQGISGHRFTSGRDLSRDGSTSARSENHYRERQVEDRRESFNHTRRMTDNAEDHNWGGRGSGRDAAGHSSRLKGLNECGDPQGSSTGQWGQGRSGFGSHRPTHTTSRVESGFITHDSVVARGGSRGSTRPTYGSSRGAGGHHHIADVEGGSNFSSRLDRGMSNSGMEPRGRGHIDRYGRSSFGNRGFEFNRSESPHKLHPADNQTVNRGTRPDSRSFSVRNQWSPPPPKWSNERREGESGIREREFKGRLYGHSGRTSPHVVHGSSLMDERDWQVLAGTRTSPTTREGFNHSKEGFNPSREGYKPSREELNSSLYSVKSRDDSSEVVRKVKRIENGGYMDSKDGDYERGSRDGVNYRDAIRGYAYQRDRDTEGIRRRDPLRLSSRDRSTSVQKHASSLEGDDDMAPRRRRPSS